MSSTADVVLALGCRFADETTSSYRKGTTYNFPDTKLIHVDIDSNELGKNYPCTIAIQDDVKNVVNCMIREFKKTRKNFDYRETEYFQDISKTRKNWFDYISNIRSRDRGFLTISQFIGDLNDIYPPEGIIVTSSGNSQSQIFQEYCFRVPGTHVTTGGFSTMGFAMNAAMGVKLARPETPVMAVIGDGDFMMNMQELSTMMQYGIPIITVVINNMGWMAIRDLQIDAYGKEHSYGNDFINNTGQVYSPDFKMIAQSFGVHAEKISAREHIENTVRKCLSLDKPSLIEVVVDREYPYSGGSATGWWDVPVPEYIKDRFDDYRQAKNEEYLR